MTIPVRFSRFPRDMMWRVASIVPFLLAWWRSIASTRMKQPRSHRSLPTGWRERLTGFSRGASFISRNIYLLGVLVFRIIAPGLQRVDVAASRELIDECDCPGYCF